MWLGHKYYLEGFNSNQGSLVSEKYACSNLSHKGYGPQAINE